MTQNEPAQGRGQRSGLARTMAVTQLAMTVERLWPLLLPAVLVVTAFACVSWFGLFRVVGAWPRLGISALFVIGGLAALTMLRHFRPPTREAVERRIEASNRLRHEPLSVQGDKPAGSSDGFAAALWREHQRRMAEALDSVEPDLPRTGVPKRDPWAARALVVLLVIVAFAFSLGPRGGSVTDVVRAAPGVASVPPRIDAWVTPPTYTGKPPIFLSVDPARKDVAAISVPEGSDVILRFTGGSGEDHAAFINAQGIGRDLGSPPAPTPSGTDKTGVQSPLGTANAPASSTTSVTSGSGGDQPAQAALTGRAQQFAGKLTEDGDLVLKDGDADVARWAFAVIPDMPPTVRFTDEPKAAANGALELHYAVTDDYGARGVESHFTLEQVQKPGAHPLYGPPEMPLGLPRRGAKDSVAKSTRDLTEHVWAGSTVRLSFSATDDAGHEGTSETKTIVLPERPFRNPLARTLVEFRKILSFDTNDKQHVLELIDAVSLRPEDTFDDLSAYVGLMAGRTRLVLAQTDEQFRDVADYFWAMALQIEDGALSTAEKRLKQAQEALKQALRDGASDEEIDKRMKELREAMADFMKEFAQRAARDPNLAQTPPQQGQELRQSDLQKMMDQIENLAKSGDRDQAEQLLSQLQDMMNNLQAQRQQPGQNGQQNEARKQMDKLGEIMRQQQQMMNETFQLDQQQKGQSGPADGQDQSGEPPGQQQGQPGKPMTPQEFAEALKQLQEGQGQLQKQLDQLKKGLEGMGMQPNQGLGEAGDAMGKAEGALGNQDGNRAVGQQGRALEALRKGAQDMMQQMQQAARGEEGGGEDGGRQQNADRDPLGRPRATTGPDFGDSVKVPDEIDVQRARQILEAIRKRLGNALSPDLEKSYLERLLNMR